MPCWAMPAANLCFCTTMWEHGAKWDQGPGRDRVAILSRIENSVGL